MMPNNKLHCEDGPALIYNGVEKWYKHGKLHREDGPAVYGVANTNSHIEHWWLNGKRHRKDGPAVVTSHKKEWWINGQLHREDGPAIEYIDTSERNWWLQGIRLSFSEWISNCGYGESEKLFYMLQYGITSESDI